MKAVAVLMIAAGLLMAGLSGLCTAAYSLGALASMFDRNMKGGLPMLVISLVVGAPFIAGGVGLLIGGQALLKRRRKNDPDVF